MSRGRALVPFVGILLLALVLRLVWPLADPPAALSWSNGVVTDPAAVVHAARVAHRTGDWAITRDLLFYPAMNAVTWLAFSGFGATRLTTQWLSALFGVVAVAGFAFAVGRHLGPSARILVAWLLAGSFWLGMFARVPIVENLTCALLGVAAWLAMGQGGAFAGALALAMAAALFGKAHAAPFTVALLVFGGLRHGSVRALLPGVGAALLVVIVWGVWLFLPNREAMLDQVTRLGENLGEGPPFLAPLRTIRTSWIFHRMPVVGALGMFFVVETLIVPHVRRRRLADGTALFPIVFLAFWIYSSVLPYQAPRYYVPAVFALVCGAAALLHEWWSGRGAEPVYGRVGAWLATITVFFIVLGGLEVLVHYATAWDQATRLRSFRSSEFATLVLSFLRPFERNAMIALGVAAVIGPWLGRARAAPRTMPGRRVAALAMLTISMVAGAQWIGWATGRTYTLEDAKRSADALLAPDARLFGTFAPAIALGSARAAVPSFGPETRRRFQESGATHLVLAQGLGDTLLSELEAERPGSVTALAGWRIRHTMLGTIRLAAVAGAGSRTGALTGSGDGPPTPAAEFERAAADLAAGRPDAAVNRLASLPESTVPDFLMLEAQARVAGGDPAGARSCLERAVAIRPSSEALYRLGQLAMADGDRRMAGVHWSHALRLDPWDDRVLTARAGLPRD